MDPFEDERGEFTGAYISMEFGPGGRITQLWASDPTRAEEGEDFQFILPPVRFGEESGEDYLPGTILIGVRSNQDDPWAVSRNVRAEMLDDDDDDDDILTANAKFRYEFPFLEELDVLGEFNEIPATATSPIPQVEWKITIRNQGKKAVEIGELGFPLAFNNFYDGFGWSDDELTRLWNSRCYVHKSITGGSSWIFAQRMTGLPPGLLVFPGIGPGWEYFSHVRASLTTPFQWEGIPVVYVHSLATIEREGIDSWNNGHSSRVLESGEEMVVSMRMVPCESDKADGVAETLSALGRPAVRAFPGMVAPIDLGLAVEVAGDPPKKFDLSRPAEMDFETDENLSFAYIQPKDAGPLDIKFRDKEDRPCTLHACFIRPIRELIEKRAEYIVGRQAVTDRSSPIYGAILLSQIFRDEVVNTPEEFAESSGVESGLADALFLAEKNAIYPDRAQIAVLEACAEEFIPRWIQNPASGAVASSLNVPTGSGVAFGRPLTYPHVANFHHALYRIATSYGELSQKPRVYLMRAARTWEALFAFGWRSYVRTVGLLGFNEIHDLIEDLAREGLTAEAAKLEELAMGKAAELMRLKSPFAGESALDTSGMAEVFQAALLTRNDEAMERIARCAFAARALSPSWWWAGSDKRSWDGADSSPLNAFQDRGEVCLGQTTIPNSLIFFQQLDRDYLVVPEAVMRLAFSGMMGPWALVRAEDGAASMSYCPDGSSRHAGFNPFTGSSGLGFFHYLRGVGAYVLPNRGADSFVFGGRFMADESGFQVEPCDGVGRKVIVRQLGLEAHLSFGCIKRLKAAPDMRSVEIDIENPSDKPAAARLTLKGLWGVALELDGLTIESKNGRHEARVTLPPRRTVTLKGRIVR
jgi:hypothetical protein